MNGIMHKIVARVLMVSAFFPYLITPALVGQDFRMETSIFAGDEKKQIAQNVTLFQEKLIYDFRLANEANPKPIEIVVFDQRQMTFTLIDVTRGYRTRLEVPQLIKMVEGLRQQVRVSEKTKFLIDPLDETMNPSGSELALSSEHIHYRIEGERPKNPDLLPRYFEYLSQFTRLMASDPKSLPPFARMQLNQSIKKMGWFPSRIEARYKPNQLIRNEIKMRSEHSFLETLSRKDEERIEMAKSLLMKSEEVSLPIYRGLTRVSSQGAGVRR